MGIGRRGSSGADDLLRDIAERLQELAADARAAAAEKSAPKWGKPTGAWDEVEGGPAIAETSRRLHAEADRAVAEAARVLDRTVDAARVRILDAEREARERILAVTEAACERIEAVDHAQERVAEALGRLGARPR